MNNQFTQVPCRLFEEPYSNMRGDSKLLYSLLLSRYSLSEKNNMKDENGEVIVFFKNDEVCRKLHCSRNKATKLFKELEGYNLIYRRKQGLGKSDIIYINTAFMLCKNVHDNLKNDDYRIPENATTDSTNLRGIYIDNSYIEKNYTYPSINYDEVEEDMKFRIEYDVLSERDYGGVLDEILNLITDTYCTTDEYVWIHKRKIPIQTVRKRFEKLTAEHIEYVISSLEKNKSGIKNMRAYLLTTIYNSIDTLETECLYANQEVQK